MKLIIFFLTIIFEICLSIRLKHKYITHNPYPNIHDKKIDISNNNTYVGRIFNGSLIVKDYTNISSKFNIINMNNTFNKTDISIDNIDKSLTEEDLDQFYIKQTFSTFDSECNFNKKIILERHNFLRNKHNASALKWNNFIEQKAKEKAKQLENLKCPYQRESEKELGVLVFNGLGTFFTEEEIVNHFYEGAYYWKWKKFEENEFKYNFFDFAQILWKKTESFGCSKACCLDNEVWVCIYNPPALAYDLNELRKNLNGPIKEFEDGFK